MSQLEDKNFLNPQSMPKPFGYSQIVVTGPGRTVYVAGQIALDAQGQLVGAGDIRAQTEQVFRNLQAAMQAAGGDLGDIVKLTVFMVDVGALAIFREVRDRFIKPGPRVPASSLVQVSALFRPEFLIEIEAIGHVAA
ncbi:RidA family protein [Rhizobium sp. P38BS-XIX]|uniref:RidA family protein n=1 Tax=Rhizobium sp. P38BS-XIX TaxID=2726740 RepID=UPI00145693DD|nr:RidA family protein [Rhizobium sp. P38BS-XIX]NLS00355.1 RidA family protein [Rhizobium sp. P38BS-XIX]